jgi:sigma-E factor negative regulatory protein RseC
MMEQEAAVIRVEGDHAYVEVGGTGGGCGRCHETGGCRSGIPGQLFRSRRHPFRVANSIGAIAGDRVVVRIREGALLQAALMAYAVPLAFLLGGACAGSALGETGREDAFAALGALTGLAAAVLWRLTFQSARIGGAAQPELLRPASTFCTSKEIRP